MCFRPAEADAGVHPVACGGCGRTVFPVEGILPSKCPFCHEPLGANATAQARRHGRRSCGTRRARPQGAHGARRARSPSGPGAEGPGDPRCAADARHGEAAITHYPARLAPFRTNPRYPHRHGSREKGERKNVTTIHRLRRRHVQDAHLRLVAAGRPSRRMRHVSQG